MRVDDASCELTEDHQALPGQSHGLPMVAREVRVAHYIRNGPDSLCPLLPRILWTHLTTSEYDDGDYEDDVVQLALYLLFGFAQTQPHRLTPHRIVRKAAVPPVPRRLALDLSLRTRAPQKKARKEER